MPVTSDDLWNNSISGKLGPNGRFFFGSPDYDFRPTIERLQKVPGLILVSHSIEAPKGLSAIWQIRFTYRGFDFLVETNHHGTASSFFVNSWECPDAILISVLEMFEALGPLFWDDEKPKIS